MGAPAATASFETSFLPNHQQTQRRTNPSCCHTKSFPHVHGRCQRHSVGERNRPSPTTWQLQLAMDHDIAPDSCSHTCGKKHSATHSTLRLRSVSVLRRTACNRRKSPCRHACRGTWHAPSLILRPLCQRRCRFLTPDCRRKTCHDTTGGQDSRAQLQRSTHST